MRFCKTAAFLAAVLLIGATGVNAQQAPPDVAGMPAIARPAPDGTQATIAAVQQAPAPPPEPETRRGGLFGMSLDLGGGNGPTAQGRSP